MCYALGTVFILWMWALPVGFMVEEWPHSVRHEVQEQWTAPCFLFIGPGSMFVCLPWIDPGDQERPLMRGSGP